MKKRVLITGINGQDGSYLTELLLEKDYEVHGILKRNSVAENQTARLDDVYSTIKDNLYYADMTDMASLVRVLQEVQPDEIYNLAAQSHVRISFDQPIYTAQTVAIGTMNLLECIRLICPNVRMYQASSSEMFGNSIDVDGFQRETTHMNPTSPYGCSKVFGYNLVRNYRNSYDLFLSNGILFNHESPRRGFEFVTRKISHAVAKIKKGSKEKLKLGNMKAKRDWGHAKDYVEAMWLMLQQDNPGDYVVGTGEEHSVEDFAKKAFSHVGLNYKDHIVIDPKLMRPAEVDTLLADCTKAHKNLKWKPKISFDDLVKNMVDHDLENVGKI